MPCRRLGRLASVVPASPTNTSSEASVRRHSASERLQAGQRSRVRTPISAPLERTSGVTASAGRAASSGRRVIVVPRASLLWKPLPAVRRSTRCCAHGPKISASLGEAMRGGRAAGVRGEVARHVEVGSGRRAGRRRCGTSRVHCSRVLAHRPDARSARTAVLRRVVAARSRATVWYRPTGSMSSRRSCSAERVDASRAAPACRSSCQLGVMPPTTVRARRTARTGRRSTRVVVEEVGEVGEQLEAVVDRRRRSRWNCAVAERALRSRSDRL